MRIRATTLVLVAAAVTLVCAVALPFAPVRQPVVEFSWPPPGAPGATAAALPLMPYQPVSFRAAVSCAAARSVPPGATVLATVPDGTPDGPVGGLRVVSTGAALAVASNGVALATVPLPSGGCTVGLDATPERTVVRLDGTPVATDARDVRPVVSALVTDAPTTAGLRVDLRTDTRFETTPTPFKIALGVGVVLGLAGVLAGAALADAARGPRRRRSRPRPGPVDAVVGAGLVVWAVIGPATVDDGYIAGIVRGRGEDGFIGNVYRWLNAPEAPFSWFYEVDRAWAALAPGPAASVLWLRVPATVLGAITWALLRRHALPRLGPALARPSAPWVAALAFAAWWLPFGLSLRPEPWVAAGVLAVWVATERAVATGRTLPLAVAAATAGLTVALTPGALSGIAPLLVALPALARATGRTGARAPAAAPRVRAAVVVAGLAVAALPMAVDQSLGGILEATRVRQVIGGGAPWSQEFDRYAALLTPGDVQGGLAPRLPVLLLLVALGAVTWSLRARARTGVAPAPAARLLATTALCLVLLTFSPTKWTLHFGEFAGLGTAVLALLVVTWSPRGVRALRRAGTGPFAPVVVLGAVVLAGGLVLAGHNQWAYASDWQVVWNTIAPELHRIRLADVALVAGTVAVLGAALVLAVVPHPGGRWPRATAAALRVLAPGTVVLVLLTGIGGLVGLSFVKVAADRSGTFSYPSDSLAALGGDPCGLASRLAVEPDPPAGLLPAALPPAGPGPSLDGFVAGAPAVPLRVAGRDLPGWAQTPTAQTPTAQTPTAQTPTTPAPAALRSPWFVLPADAREGRAPVVVTVSGTTAARATVSLAFSDGAAGPDGPVPTATVAPVGDPGAAPDGQDEVGPRDLRAVAPTGATLVRVVATASAPVPAGTALPAAAGSGTALPSVATAAPTPLGVAVPRVPRTVPFDSVVAPGSPALVDWPVALVFGCLRPAALAGGTAEIPPWRLVPPGGSDAGQISVAPQTGGPFLTPRQLVSTERVPVYLDGDPTRDAVGLDRWVPTAPRVALSPRVGSETVAGWTREGRATVPGLDGP